MKLHVEKHASNVEGEEGRWIEERFNNAGINSDRKDVKKGRGKINKGSETHGIV